MRFRTCVFLAALCALTSCQDSAYAPYPRELVPGTVRHYSCRLLRPKKLVDEKILVIDGLLDEVEWKTAPWSEPFIDIEGSSKPTPRYATWMKMLWDTEYLYIAAHIEEPDLWATMDKRDMVVFVRNLKLAKQK